MKELVIFGAWYFNRVVAEAAEATGWEVLGYVDPEPPENVITLKAIPDKAAVYVAVGDNLLREMISLSLVKRGRKIVTIVHPNACISPSSVIGEGSFIAELATVRTSASLGRGVILQAGSVVSHDCHVGSFASFGPNAATASRVQVGQRTLVGVGASVAPGMSIGDDCTVAAGASVYKNAGDKTTIIGNPAIAKPSPHKETKQSNWKLNTTW